MSCRLRRISLSAVKLFASLRDAPDDREAIMSDNEISFSMRNILLLQLLTLFVVKDSALQLCQNLLKTWKSLKTLLRAWKPSDQGKRGKFWEVDMTKFEP